MKKCPFCAEEIQDEAVKCKHCGEFLDGRPREAAAPSSEKTPWFYAGWSVWLSIATIGPLALPLVWKNPRYSQTKKIVITVIVIVVTYVLIKATAKAWNEMMDIFNGKLPGMSS